MSIALCCNVYQDAPALRGLLELGSRYFDNIFIVHSGPGGARSTDGTIEVCEGFGATIVYDNMDRGFGEIRTRLIHECGCEWAFLMDADERFFPHINVIRCDGTDRYPNPLDPKLIVTHHKELIDQGANLKVMISNPLFMAIRTTRRHWFDFTMKKAAENWEIIWDHQMRIVRNLPTIGYVRDRKMHEHLIDTRTGVDPVYGSQDPIGGPFHDHFHLFYRRTQPGHKEWNEQNYSRLSRGETMLVR